MLICIAFLHRCDIAALGFSPLSNNLTSQQFYNYQILKNKNKKIPENEEDWRPQVFAICLELATLVSKEEFEIWAMAVWAI